MQLQIVVWHFYASFEAVSSSLLSGLSCNVDYRTCFTVDIDNSVPVSFSSFTRSFAFVRGLICTFHTKVCSSLGDRGVSFLSGMMPAWSQGVCTDERGTFRRLEIAPKDEPDL